MALLAVVNAAEIDALAKYLYGLYRFDHAYLIYDLVLVC
jgi:hypothetical protein